MARKDQVTELAKRLRDAAQMQDPIAKAAIELVKLSADDLKERLVDADGEDMLRVQGAAQQFNRLYRELTTNPPSIQQVQE